MYVGRYGVRVFGIMMFCIFFILICKTSDYSFFSFFVVMGFVVEGRLFVVRVGNLRIDDKIFDEII